MPASGYITSFVEPSIDVGIYGDVRGSGMVRSNDGGYTWKQLAVGDPRCIGAGGGTSLWFSDAQDGWAIISNTAGSACPVLFRTIDYGATWSALPNPFSTAGAGAP